MPPIHSTVTKFVVEYRQAPNIAGSYSTLGENVVDDGPVGALYGGFFFLQISIQNGPGVSRKMVHANAWASGTEDGIRSLTDS